MHKYCSISINWRYGEQWDVVFWIHTDPIHNVVGGCRNLRIDTFICVNNAHVIDLWFTFKPISYHIIIIITVHEEEEEKDPLTPSYLYLYMYVESHTSEQW